MVWQWGKILWYNIDGEGRAAAFNSDASLLIVLSMNNQLIILSTSDGTTSRVLEIGMSGLATNNFDKTARAIAASSTGNLYLMNGYY
jgi:uncharacterized protein YjiK